MDYFEPEETQANRDVHAVAHSLDAEVEGCRRRAEIPDSPTQQRRLCPLYRWVPTTIEDVRQPPVPIQMGNPGSARVWLFQLRRACQRQGRWIFTESSRLLAYAGFDIIIVRSTYLFFSEQKITHQLIRSRRYEKSRAVFCVWYLRLTVCQELHILR